MIFILNFIINYCYYLGCSKDTRPICTEETPTTEHNVSSISDTIESVIYAACTNPPNVSSEYTYIYINII